MCLAVPAQLHNCTQSSAIADLHGNRIEISTMLLPDVRDGDWVLVHAGFAIQKLQPDELEETWAVLRDAKSAATSGGAP